MSDPTVWVAVIGAVATIFAGQGFWDYLRAKRSRRSKTEDILQPFERMIISLGRDRIIQLSKDLMEIGYMRPDDFTNLTKLGEAYIAMGGNSIAQRYLEDALQLPIKEED